MEEIMTKFTAAVIQAGSVPFDSKSSTEKACKLIAEAAQRGAKLLVFPEAFISAYPKGLDFGARVRPAFSGRTVRFLALLGKRHRSAGSRNRNDRSFCKRQRRLFGHRCD